MAKVIRKLWVAEQTSGLPRRDRRSCEYAAYLPDVLSSRDFSFDGEVAADIAEAETAIARLDAETDYLADTEALARLLLRAEAVASSQIEGLEVGARRLLRAEAAQAMGESTSDVTAEAVLGNILAMREALSVVDGGSDISVEELLGIHARLMDGTRLESYGGRVRDVQNWVGGSAYNPCSAEFVPPPPERVEDLLQDLCSFCNDDALPTVAQAAIAHAQFETIHPFMDGNGRVGRALVHMVLRRRGLASRVLPPVSLVLATWSQDYIGGLSAYRYVGSSSSEAAQAGLDQWVGVFAAACKRAVHDARAFERQAQGLKAVWRQRLKKVRADSSVDLLLGILPGTPLLTVKSAADMLGRSTQAVNQAMARLVEAGVLRQVTVGRRNRAFEAPEAIDTFTDLERKLASPVGDTHVEAPARPVPGA